MIRLWKNCTWWKTSDLPLKDSSTQSIGIQRIGIKRQTSGMFEYEQLDLSATDEIYTRNIRSISEVHD